METITINVYQFSELSEQAKRKAINNYNNNQYFDYIWHEGEQTVTKFCELTNVRTGRNSWLDFNINNIDDTILELTGVRLMKYFINNFAFLYKAKYLKHFNSHKNHRMVKNKTANRTGKEYGMAYSNVQEVRDCTLTGVCWNEDFLDPIYSFIKNPNSNETFQDVISDCFSSLRKAIEREIEYQQSDEAIIENIEANEYRFEQDGSLSKY